LFYIQLYNYLPWFEFFFVDPVGENQLLFETDKHLGIIKSPVLILHAEDDMVVPYQLGRRVCISCINREFIAYFSFPGGGSKRNSLTLPFEYSPFVHAVSIRFLQ
jgi:pimeloyl-ACP methyl ester carboxylesterase